MSQPIQDVMKEIMTEAEPGHHVGIADLADYLDQLLSENEAATIRAHLTVCPKCTQSLLELHDLAEGKLESASLQENPVGKGRLLGFLARTDLAWAVAAVLFLALLFQWQGEQHNLEQTQIAIMELFPTDALNKSTTEEEEIVPEHIRVLTLVLHTETNLEQSQYWIHLEFPNRKAHHFLDNPNQEGIFEFTWPVSTREDIPNRLTILDREGKQIAQFSMKAAP